MVYAGRAFVLNHEWVNTLWGNWGDILYAIDFFTVLKLFTSRSIFIHAPRFLSGMGSIAEHFDDKLGLMVRCFHGFTKSIMPTALIIIAERAFPTYSLVTVPATILSYMMRELANWKGSSFERCREQGIRNMFNVPWLSKKCNLMNKAFHFGSTLTSSLLKSYAAGVVCGEFGIDGNVKQAVKLVVPVLTATTDLLLDSDKLPCYTKRFKQDPIRNTLATLLTIPPLVTVGCAILQNDSSMIVPFIAYAVTEIVSENNHSTITACSFFKGWRSMSMILFCEILLLYLLVF